MAAGEAEQPVAEDQRQGGEHQHAAEHRGEQMGDARVGAAELRQHVEREGGGGDAADGELADDAPIDMAVEAMHHRAGGLGGGSEQQVGADGGGRVDAEQQDEQRGHQRAAADAGEADDQTDEKARQRIERIDAPDQMHAPAPMVAQAIGGAWRRPLLWRAGFGVTAGGAAKSD